MIANVFAALRFLGSLKLGTALLMASTPVNEDEPAEKAFKNRGQNPEIHIIKDCYNFDEILTILNET